MIMIMSASAQSASSTTTILQSRASRTRTKGCVRFCLKQNMGRVRNASTSDRFSLLASSSSSSDNNNNNNTSKEDEDEDAAAAAAAKKKKKNESKCDSCGIDKDRMQCDGSGRIQGGLAAVKVFSWWPIKAYRPCPGLIESGGTYTRKGQDVDSILWGENGRN
jgi:hypothetical protein